MLMPLIIYMVNQLMLTESKDGGMNIVFYEMISSYSFALKTKFISYEKANH
jgi:hypothetical protein